MARQTLGNPQPRPAIPVGLLGHIPLDLRDRQGAVTEKILQTVPLALVLHRTQPCTYLRQDISLPDDLVGLAVVTGEERLHEGRDVHPRWAAARTGCVGTVTASARLLEQHFAIAHPPAAVNLPIDLRIADHAAGPPAVAHNLRAGAAAQAHPVRVQLSFSENIFRKTRVCKRHPPHADQRRQAVMFARRRRKGHHLP